MAGVSVCLGPGIAAQVRATEAAQVGVSILGGVRAGSWGRGAGLWGCAEVDLGLSPIWWYRAALTRDLGGDVPDQEIKGAGLSLIAPDDEDARNRRDDLTRGFWDFGGTLHAAIIGVDAFVNPAEILDFIVGIFGLDIMGDDYGASFEEILRDLDAPTPRWTAAARDARMEDDESVAPLLLAAMEDPRFEDAAVRSIVRIQGWSVAPAMILRVMEDPSLEDPAFVVLDELARWKLRSLRGSSGTCLPSPSGGG
jgi:hypothetical protein